MSAQQRRYVFIEGKVSLAEGASGEVSYANKREDKVNSDSFSSDFKTGQTTDEWSLLRRDVVKILIISFFIVGSQIVLRLTHF